MTTHKFTHTGNLTFVEGDTTFVQVTRLRETKRYWVTPTGAWYLKSTGVAYEHSNYSADLDTTSIQLAKPQQTILPLGDQPPVPPTPPRHTWNKASKVKPTDHSMVQGRGTYAREKQCARCGLIQVSHFHSFQFVRNVYWNTDRTHATLSRTVPKCELTTGESK